MSDEREEKQYCERCKRDTMMMVHHSISFPTQYTCMECGQQYVFLDGELLICMGEYEYEC